MIIQTVKSSRNISVIFFILAFALIILRISGSFIIIDNPKNTFPLIAELFFSFIRYFNVPEWALLLITSLLVGFQALQWNKIITNHEVLYKPSYLPALIYITCMSLFKEFLALIPVILCNGLIVLIIKKIFQLYNTDKFIKINFEIGLLCAISALIYLPSLVVFVLYLVSIHLLKTTTINEWMAGICGFILPYFFILFYYYWINSTEEFVINCFPFIFQYPLIALKLNFISILPSFIACFILTLSFIKLVNNFMKNNIMVRKFQQVLILFIVLSLFSFMLQPQSNFGHFAIMIIPASVFIAYYFLANKNVWITEIIYLFLVSSILFSQLMEVYWV